MKIFTSITDPGVAALLMSGGIGVLRTDTLYGVVADAQNEEAVDRIYRLKARDEAKSPIVLVASVDQLFDDIDQPSLLNSYWPGKVSIILPAVKAPQWISRDNHSVAYRLPAKPSLQSLLSETGPLIAPSANPEGLQPASTIREAQAYFGDAVDFYVDEGKVEDDSPSRLIRITSNGEVEELR
jgi:L-threonylcarbamoyladenylate synthase